MQPAYLSSYEYSTPRPPKQQPDGEPRRTGTILRFFKWTGAIIVGFLVILAFIGWLFSDEITQKAIQAISKELKTELKVKSVELSLIKSFPQAAVLLHDVQIGDAFGGHLVMAKEISLRFDLLSVFSSHIDLKEIVMKGGALHLITDKQGRQNFDIFKSSGSTDNQQITIDIRRARLVDVEVRMENAQVPFDGAAKVHEARFAGRFGTERFGMESDSKLTMHYLLYNGKRYFEQTPMGYETALTVDLLHNAWQVKKGKLRLGASNVLDMAGMAIFQKKYTDLDLKLQLQNGDVSLLLDLLPSKYTRNLKDLRSTGKYYCSGTIKGRITPGRYPAVRMDFGMQGGKITSNRLAGAIQNVQFAGKLTLKPDGDGQLLLPDLRATYAGTPVSLSLSLTDFRRPFIDLKANGRLELHKPTQINSDEALALLHGSFDFQNIELRGSLADMRNSAARSKVHAQGTVILRQIGLQSGKNTIDISTGSISLKEGNCLVQDLAARYAGSDFQLNGRISPILPALFGEATDQLFVEADVHAKTMNLDRLMDALAGVDTDAKSNKTSGQSLATPDFGWMKPLRGHIKLSADQLQYQKVAAQSFKSELTLHGLHLPFKATGQAMKGAIALAGQVEFGPKIRMDLNAGLREIDLQTCFAQTNSFDQEMITDKNIRGTMTGRVATTAFWTADGTWLPNELKVYSDLLAHDGSLHGVKAFEDFSQFIHIDDLRNIKFHTLQNYIEVSNGRVWLPSMFIRNNACNMTISGVHSFDQKMNYFIKVNAGDVLLNRIMRNNRDEERLSSDNGLVNLYYVIRGTTDQYEIFRNKKSARTAFEESSERKSSIAQEVEAAFKRYPPDFQMVPLREISPTDLTTEQAVLDPQPEPPVSSKPRPAKEKPVQVTRPTQSSAHTNHIGLRPVTTIQSLVLPAPAPMYDPDEVYLDEISGGN